MMWVLAEVLRSKLLVGRGFLVELGCEWFYGGIMVLGAFDSGCRVENCEFAG